MSYLFAAAFAVLLVQLLILAEGAKRACPEISNISANANQLSNSSSIVVPKPQESVSFLLATLFNTTDHLACQCNFHEVICGRPRLKARANRCE